MQSLFCPLNLMYYTYRIQTHHACMLYAANSIIFSWMCNWYTLSIKKAISPLGDKLVSSRYSWFVKIMLWITHFLFSYNGMLMTVTFLDVVISASPSCLMPYIGEDDVNNLLTIMKGIHSGCSNCLTTGSINVS